MDPEKNVFTEIIERLARIETRLDHMPDPGKKAEDAEVKALAAEKIANEALSSSKSAHHRLDKVDKIIFWAGSTIIGSVIIAMLALVYNTK